MKRKVFAGILMLALTAGVTAGCGKQEVDYSIDGKGTESSSGNGSGENVENSLAQFKNVETWTDEWTITDENGKEKTVMVDAEVVMPDLDKLSVVEVEAQPFDASFRKRFLMAYYENGEIYEHEPEQYTKEELEDIIAEMEEHTEEVDEEAQEEWQQSMEAYEEQLATAPDEYVTAEDYGNCNHYIGYRGEYLSSVEFSEEEELVYALGNIEPEELRDYEKVYQLSKEEMRDLEGMENGCQLTMTEARHLADSFLIKIGRDGQVCTEASDVMWKGENYDGSGALTDQKRILYGYSFTYGTGVDNMAFSQSPDFADFDFAWQEGIAYADYNNGDSIEIVVTDEGVADVYMMDPVTVRTCADAVDLLPLDTVKDIIKNEAIENTQKYDLTSGSGANRREFNSLKLIYMKMQDESQAGMYSYVPIWCASKYMPEGGIYFHPIFVNAIDGSIIYVNMKNNAEESI